MSAFKAILGLIVPAVLTGALLEVFLSPRHDYTGHFLAGYGGTLAACMFVLKLAARNAYQVAIDFVVLVVCVACIALGTLTKATIFRIAKFDEIDFCSQSLGAVLAAVAAMGISSRGASDKRFDSGLIAGIAFLGTGGCFAVA